MTNRRTFLQAMLASPGAAAYLRAAQAAAPMKIKRVETVYWKSRDDAPFWQYCRKMEVPATLAHRMRLFRETGRMFRDGNELFDDSWLQVMIGQGLMPQSYHPLVDTMSTAELQQFLIQIRQRISQTVASLPAHANYVARYSSGHS